MRSRRLAAGPVLLFVLSCATPAPREDAATAAKPPPMPVGPRRLPSSIGCESERVGEAAPPIGSLDKEAIAGIVRAHLGELKACHDAIASSHAGTEGRVMARFAISPSGAVEASCLVTSSLNDASLDRCVVDHLLTWKFPAPGGGGWVVVDYPFVFTR